MITVPALPDLLKPGAPVVVSPDSPMIDEHPSVVVAVIRRLGAPDVFRVAGSSTGVWSGNQLALILDDPDRIGQTLALGWLARRLGVPVDRGLLWEHEIRGRMDAMGTVHAVSAYWRFGNRDHFRLFSPVPRPDLPLGRGCLIVIPGLPTEPWDTVLALALAVETVGANAELSRAR